MYKVFIEGLSKLLRRLLRYKDWVQLERMMFDNDEDSLMANLIGEYLSIVETRLFRDGEVLECMVAFPDLKEGETQAYSIEIYTKKAKEV